MQKVKQRISDGIAGKIGDQRCAAVIATANDEDQRECLRQLGFKRMHTYYSHTHHREVFVYIRKTTPEEHRRGMAEWFFKK